MTKFSPGAAKSQSQARQMHANEAVLRKRQHRLAGALVAATFVFTAALRADTFVLTGATVHTVSGNTLAPGQVLVRDGKIAEVGSTVSAENVTKVDLTRQHLYPGLICLDTVLG